MDIKQNARTNEHVELDKLIRRIRREFSKKKYISDIKINEEEYVLLKSAVKSGIQRLKLNKSNADPMMLTSEFAVGIVQIALRVYEKNGGLWDNLFKELYDKKIRNQVTIQYLIGPAFLKILEKFNLLFLEGEGYVNNILFHCFVSNHYLDNYFHFLDKFYSIDLDRDITRLDRVIMNSLIDSICVEGSGGRAYMLVKQTEDAIRANAKGAKIRIRNHLKLMDKLFWDSEYEVKSNHRIYTSMATWARTQKELQDDARGGLLGHRRGAHHFSSPYLFYDEANDKAKLILPAQSVKKDEDLEIYWSIDGGHCASIFTDLKDSVIGYRVLETSISIPYGKAMEAFSIELRSTNGVIYRKFKIPASEIRFFDNAGYPSSKDRIKVGEMSAFTLPGNEAESPALYEKRLTEGIAISYYNFSSEDIVRLPDGSAVVVGRKEFTDALFGKGRIEDGVCLIDDESYPLYSRMPNLIIRLPDEKAAGTLLEMNGVRYRFESLKPTRIFFDGLSPDSGYYVNLDQFTSDKNGLYELNVDIPGNSRRTWKFVYIGGFEAEFDGAPYIFQPRGAVTFPENINAIPNSQVVEKESCENTYKFEIDKVGRTIEFIVQAGDRDCIVRLPVPALYTRVVTAEWTPHNPDTIWHEDMPDVIDISAPSCELRLSMDLQTDDDTVDPEKTICYQKKSGADYFQCDIKRLKSYIKGGVAIKTIRAEFGDEKFDLLKILSRGDLITASIVGDFDNAVMNISYTINGKGKYYLDLYYDERCIVDKKAIIGETITMPFDCVKGSYRAIFYEADADGAGFTFNNYRIIGEKVQKVANPYDMSERTLKIIKLKRRNGFTQSRPLSYEFYINRLQQLEEESMSYRGMMVIAQKEVSFASFPVKVSFEDILSCSVARIWFYDEYGDEVDFLYDTKHLALIQEESAALTKKECYRIYSLLDMDEDIYQIALYDNVKINSDGLPDKFEIFDSAEIIARARKKYAGARRLVRIWDLDWPRGTFEILRYLGLNTLNELSDLTIDEFVRITGADDRIIYDVQVMLANYSMSFRKE